MLAPEIQKEALVLRSAGYPLSVICERLECGPTALKSLFAKHGVKRGDAKKEAIEAARKQLLHDSQLQDDLRLKINQSIECDLASGRKLKEAALLQLEELASSTCELPVHIKARALAAISTSISLSQQIVRRALCADKAENQNRIESLPILQIHYMSPEEQESVRSLVEEPGFGMPESLDGVADDIIIEEG